MAKSVLYMGDTRISEAAGYLAGVMTHYNIGFDYVASDAGLAEGFPAEPYKVLILSDYPASNFKNGQLEQIAGLVAKGTGLIMIGGWDSFTGLGGGYNKTHLKNVLPVIMMDSDDRKNCSGPSVIVKKCGHEIVDMLPFDEDAPVVGGFNLLRAKNDADTVLSVRPYHASLKENRLVFKQSDEFPLLVTSSYGNGRLAVLACDVAPHWVGGLVDWGQERIAAQAKGANPVEVGSHYARLLYNMINWVGRGVYTDPS